MLGTFYLFSAYDVYVICPQISFSMRASKSPIRYIQRSLNQCGEWLKNFDILVRIAFSEWFWLKQLWILWFMIDDLRSIILVWVSLVMIAKMVLPIWYCYLRWLLIINRWSWVGDFRSCQMIWWSWLRWLLIDR